MKLCYSPPRTARIPASRHYCVSVLQKRQDGSFVVPFRCVVHHAQFVASLGFEMERKSTGFDWCILQIGNAPDTFITGCMHSDMFLSAGLNCHRARHVLAYQQSGFANVTSQKTRQSYSRIASCPSRTCATFSSADARFHRSNDDARFYGVDHEHCTRPEGERLHYASSVQAHHALIVSTDLLAGEN